MFLSSHLALDGGWVVSATPRPLNLGQTPGTHYIGSWVGPRTDVSGCGKCQPPWDSIHGENLNIDKTKNFQA
jgi:hypothetical protein